MEHIDIHAHHNHTRHEYQERTATKSTLNKMAASATLHCLTGCAIGEVAGLVIGTAFAWNNAPTTILSILLAFVFGFTLSTIPLRKAGLGLSAALSIVVASDMLSITTMEIADNAVMYAIPGAMHVTVLDPLFWASMAISLAVAYIVAYPVNRYLLTKGKGHALVMQYHKGHTH